MTTLRLRVSVVGGVFLFLAGCNYSILDKSGRETQSSPPINKASIGYPRVNDDLFAPRCVACHGAGTANAGVRLDTYANVIENLDRAQAAIHAGTMPPTGPLESGLTELLDGWVSNGVPESSPVPTPVPTPAPPTGIPTFAELSSSLFTPRCIACHSSFKTIEGVRKRVAPGDPASSDLFLRVAKATGSGKMPPSGSRLTQNQIERLRGWIANGAKD